MSGENVSQLCTRRNCKKAPLKWFCRCGAAFCSEACFVQSWHAEHRRSCPCSVEIFRLLDDTSAIADASSPEVSPAVARRGGRSGTAKLCSIALSRTTPAVRGRSDSQELEPTVSPAVSELLEETSTRNGSVAGSSRLSMGDCSGQVSEEAKDFLVMENSETKCRLEDCIISGVQIGSGIYGAVKQSNMPAPSPRSLQSTPTPSPRLTVTGALPELLTRITPASSPRLPSVAEISGMPTSPPRLAVVDINSPKMSPKGRQSRSASPMPSPRCVPAISTGVVGTPSPRPGWINETATFSPAAFSPEAFSATANALAAAATLAASSVSPSPMPTDVLLPNEEDHMNVSFGNLDSFRPPNRCESTKDEAVAVLEQSQRLLERFARSTGKPEVASASSSASAATTDADKTNSFQYGSAKTNDMEMNGGDAQGLDLPLGGTTSWKDSQVFDKIRLWARKEPTVRSAALVEDLDQTLSIKPVTPRMRSIGSSQLDAVDAGMVIATMTPAFDDKLEMQTLPSPSRPPPLIIPDKCISADVEKDEFSPIENTWSNTNWESCLPQRQPSAHLDVSSPEENAHRRPTPPRFFVPADLAEATVASSPRSVSEDVDDDLRNSIEGRYDALDLYNLAQKIRSHTEDQKKSTPRPGGADAAGGGGVSTRAKELMLPAGFNSTDHRSVRDRESSPAEFSPISVGSEILSLGSILKDDQVNVEKTGSVVGGSADNEWSTQLTHIKQLSADISSVRACIFEDLNSTLKTLQSPAAGSQTRPYRLATAHGNSAGATQDRGAMVPTVSGDVRTRPKMRSRRAATDVKAAADVDLLGFMGEDQTIDLDDLDESAFLRPLDTRDFEFGEA